MQTKPSKHPIKQAHKTNATKFDSHAYRIEIVSDQQSFAQLSDQWSSLNHSFSKGTVFISWEWLYTWWEVFQDDGNRSLFILVCRDMNQTLVGIAPLQILNNPKRYFPCNRQIVFLGTGETQGDDIFGEYMDLLIKPGHETQVCLAFSTCLIEHQALWDGAKFHQLLADSHLSKLFQQQSQHIQQTITVNGFRTYIRLPETYKTFLMSLRKKMRNNITRTFTRLQNEQNFTLKSINDGLDPDYCLSTLAELNRDRRGNHNHDSVFNSPRFEQFHRILIKRLLPQDKVQLRILYFDNTAVAAIYGFLDKDMIHIYQSGFKNQYGRRYSLLTTLLTQEIAASIDNPRIKVFNFMYEDHEATYKKRYSSSTETMYDISYDKKTLKCKLYQFIHGPVKSLLKRILRRNIS